MADSLDPLVELINLYDEILIKEISIKTSDGSIVWTAPNSGKFTATVGIWDFEMTKVALDSSTNSFSLEVDQNDVLAAKIENSNGVEQLFEAISLVVDGLDTGTKEAVCAVKDF